MGEFVKPEIQFPFLITPGCDINAVRSRADTIIRGISAMITKLIVSADNYMSDNEIDETYTDVLEFLWTDILPAYDAWRQPYTSPTSYCFVCIRNRISDILSARKGRKAKFIRCADPSELTGMESPDQSSEAAVLNAAQAILAEPLKYFSKAQVRALEALIANPGAPLKTIAKAAGLKYQRNLSVTFQRMRQRLADIELEHYAAHTTPINPQRSAEVTLQNQENTPTRVQSGRTRKTGQSAAENKAASGGDANFTT